MTRTSLFTALREASWRDRLRFVVELGNVAFLLPLILLSVLVDRLRRADRELLARALVDPRAILWTGSWVTAGAAAWELTLLERLGSLTPIRATQLLLALGVAVHLLFVAGYQLREAETEAS